MQSVNQRRAQLAFGKITELGGPNDLLTVAKDLPSMFQNNGLLATWAFLIHKAENNKPGYRDVLIILMERLKEFDETGLGTYGTANYLDAFRDYLLQTPDKIMPLTAEAIDFSGWIKRAAEALCQASTTEGQDG